MRTKIFTFLLIFIAFGAIAQPQWVRTAGSEGFEYGNAIATDASGNVYVTGQIEFLTAFEGGPSLYAVGGHDIYVAKYNSSGALEWAKRAGHRTGDVGQAIGVDLAGNVYIAGEFEDTATFEGTTIVGADTVGALEDHNEIFIAKYDASGNLVWVKPAGGPYHDKAQGMAVDAGGNIYLTGYFTGHGNFGGPKVSGHGGPDVFLTKFDTNGNEVWVKIMGGTGADEGKGIAIDAAGNVYLTGGYEGVVTNLGNSMLTSQGKADLFIAKFDSNGNNIWVFSAGGAEADKGRGITVDATGNVYTTGEIWGSTSFGPNAITPLGWTDVFISKHDASGNLIWVKIEGGNSRDAGRAIAVSGANLYVTGDYASTSTFGTIQMTAKGTSTDMFLAKYDLSGVASAVQVGGGWGDDAGKGVVVDASEMVLTTGYYSGDADWSWTINKAGSGKTDMFVARYTTVTTGIDLFEKTKQITLSPNPSNGLIRVNNNSTGDLKSIEIFDGIGQVIYSKTVNGANNEDIDLSSFTNGIYLFKILSSDGITSHRVIKQ